VKAATPLVRVAEPSGTGQGSVVVSAKGDKVSVTIAVAKLPSPVAAPLGVFLEDGAAAGTFTQVGSIDALSQGGGRLALASSEGVPSALGIGALDELVGRAIEVRDGGGAALLRGALPGLGKFAGTKLTGKLAAAPGSPVPGASATCKGTPSAKKGSEKFLFQAKGLAPGAAYALHLEDAIGSGVFVPAGDLVGGTLLRDTARGDPLPLGVASLADLTGRAAEVRESGSGTPVVAGPIPFAIGVVWPREDVIVLDVPGSTTDRYLRSSGGAIVVYRSPIDLSEVSIALLEREGEGLWRLDFAGSESGDAVVTARLAGNDRFWWSLGNTADAFGFAQHFLRLENRGSPPTDLAPYKFVLREQGTSGGRRAYWIESFAFPGEFLLDDGHGLSGNGVRIGKDRTPALFVLR
jgi:hypothetical protein